MPYVRLSSCAQRAEAEVRVKAALHGVVAL
jgi:hypothetical protein